MDVGCSGQSDLSSFSNKIHNMCLFFVLIYEVTGQPTASYQYLIPFDRQSRILKFFHTKPRQPVKVN